MEESPQKNNKSKKKSAAKSAPCKTKKSAGDGSGKQRRCVNSAAAVVATKAAGSVKRTANQSESHGNRLRANTNHTNSGLISPGEPNLVFSPCGGDIPTMICDVSPVPSDVESINEHAGPLIKGKGHYSSYSLRGSLHSKPSFDRDKRKVLQSMTASRQSIDADSESEVSVSMPKVKHSISVPIVPESTKTGSKLTKSISSKQLTSNSIKSSSKHSTKPLSQTESKTKSFKQQKTLSQSSILSNANTKKKDENQQQPKTSCEDELENEKSVDLSTSVTDKIDNIDINREDESVRSSAGSELYEEIAFEVPVRLNVAEDEECCKAYEVLKRHGFNVTLHTLRRALLTPTQYRELRELEVSALKPNEK